MDIRVSQLNKRMTLQIPNELPLGLVFVVGKVVDLAPAGSDDSHDLVAFYLLDGDHRLRCRLSERAGREVNIREGDTVRAGGHLSFDPARADYFLLARDIERIAESESRPRSPASLVTDLEKRAQAASLAPAELPGWVKEIAPPELQEQFQAAFKEDDDDLADIMIGEPAGADRPVRKESEPPAEPLSPDLVAFFSEATEREEEVEFPPDLLAELAAARQPAGKKKKGDFQMAQPYDVSRPAKSGKWEWVIVIVALFLLLAALVILLVLAASVL